MHMQTQQSVTVRSPRVADIGERKDPGTGVPGSFFRPTLDHSDQTTVGRSQSGSGRAVTDHRGPVTPSADRCHMPTFPALTIAEPDPLSLPVGGKTYEFSASVPLKTGMALARLREEVMRFTLALVAGREPDPKRELLDDTSETLLIKQLIGDELLEQMEADGLTWTNEVQRVGKTLIQWHLWGEEQAMSTWTGEKPAADEQVPPAEQPEAAAPAGEV